MYTRIIPFRYAFLLGISLCFDFSYAQSNEIQSVDLNAKMDQNSRYYDYFSDAYAEISLDPDGFYQIGNPDQQYGSFDVFVNQDSLDLGDLVVDAKNLTGKGVENVSITGWKLDLYKSIDVTNPYSTEVSNITGTLTFVDGIASNLNLECDIILTFTSGLVNGLAFPGQIIVKDNHLQIDADKTHSTQLGDYRNQWEIKGQIDLPGLSTKIKIKQLAKGSELLISWYGVPGFNYQIQTKENFSTIKWINEGNSFEGEGKELSISIDNNNRTKFYRVLVSDKN